MTNPVLQDKSKHDANGCFFRKFGGFLGNFAKNIEMNSMILVIFIDDFGFCKENYRISYHCLPEKNLLFDFGKLMKIDSGMFVC